MAQADQHTPIEWGDEDRWTLDEAFHYLTVTLGYTEKRALDELEQARLGRRLVIQVHKIVEGKRQAGEYLPPEKKHKLVLDLGWVRPLALKWSGNRCTVYKQRVLELWPRHLPASQQQTEDKTAPDPSAAAQRRSTKASKPDSGAKPNRKSSPEQVARDAAIRDLLKGARPGSTVTWPKFCHAVRVKGDGFIGDPKNDKHKRGFSDDTIEEVTRELMKLLPR